jgi:tetratricopeptide (TPR) repeat protein
MLVTNTQPTPSSSHRRRQWPRVILILVFMSTTLALVYSPGLSGPFTLDDNSNLLSNPGIQITDLNLESLSKAAFSIRSGPTYRPIAMVTFAINYYFAGSFGDSGPYKITNVAIHVVNSALAFWFIYLLLGKVAMDKAKSFSPLNSRLPDTRLFVSAVIALIWAIHPIQLTSVLYVVQRMTSLAGMFVLLSLIAYLIGRNKLEEGKISGALFGIGLSTLLGLASVFAKENGALFPFYILAMELTIFHHSKLRDRWIRFSRTTRIVAILFAGLLSITLIYLAFVFSLPGYASKSFTMGERLLTEPRVLVFYISLILVPRINQFGLHHDDIPISHSLIEPWTTIPSIIILLSLLVAAAWGRKRFPLFSLGIFTFFAAHLFESTTYALDIAYEHRNYFASLGILLAVSQCIMHIGHRIGMRAMIPVVVIYTILLGSTTYIRATQWSSDSNLYAFEALHHPDSAILNFELAGLLESKGKHTQAVNAARKAVSLDSRNLAFRIFLSLLLSRNNLPLDPENNRAVQELLLNGRITPTTYLLLKRVVACSSKDCTSLLPSADKWLYALVNKRGRKHLSQEFNHMYGVIKYNEGDLATARESMLKAINLDPGYIPAYLDLATIYVNTNNRERAIEVYSVLITIDAANSDRYTDKIETLSRKND